MIGKLMYGFVILVFGTGIGLGQKSASTNAAANKAWPAFYAKFRAAVNKRDQSALKRVISVPFNADPDLSNPTPDQVISGLDHGKMGGWKQLKKDVAAGIFVFHKRRFTKKTYFYFDFRDGRWFWSGWMPEFEGI